MVTERIYGLQLVIEIVEFSHSLFNNMDKYHIYEELGKGQYSQIFKVLFSIITPLCMIIAQGREKKSIEYVAIKRVDKNMMNNVRQIELN